MARLNGIYPCIEHSEWSENRVEFWFSERDKIDVSFEADGGLTIHGSGSNGNGLVVYPRVSNEIIVRLGRP